MNKSLKSLLLGVLSLGACSLSAYTNKTFLKSRNQALVNLPVEMTTFQERIGARLDNRFGGNLEVVGFYATSANSKDLGRYFGAYNEHETPIQKMILSSGLPSGVSSLSTGNSFDVGYIIHDPTTNKAALPATKISLNPKSSHYGFDLVYYQNLSKVLYGLYLKVNLPIELVENDVNIDVDGGFEVSGDTIPGSLATRTNIYNFFAGNYVVAAGEDVNNAQQALTAGKINGKRTATGVADIDIQLGYNFLRTESYHVGISLGLTVPTGNDVTGEYLFEPLYGTKNFGFGAGLEASNRLWGDANHNIKVNGAVNYRYLFQATEKRVLGIAADKWGQYELLALNGAAVATPDAALVPAANLFNQHVYVTPGSQLDAFVGLAYNLGGFSMDLGYNLYFRDKESLLIKSNPFSFTADQYFTANKNLDTSTGAATDAEGRDVLASSYGLAGQADGGIGASAIVPTEGGYGLIVAEDVKTKPAATPAQISNGMYCGLGYAFKEWRCPLMLGIGGKYDFASNNNIVEMWQLYGKIGLSF